MMLEPGYPYRLHAIKRPILCVLVSLSASLSACGTRDSFTEPPAASANPSNSASPDSDNTSTTSLGPTDLTNLLINPMPPETEKQAFESEGEQLAELENATSATDPDNSTATSTSCTADEQLLQQRTLQLINEARATERMCGDVNFPATRALSWDTRLADAAHAHSLDMASSNFFSHGGSDGSDVSARIEGAGYAWRAVGENIAAGQSKASEVIKGWLNSEGHCRNLMNPTYSQMAVACAEDGYSDFERYWTNVLAAPR